MILSLDLDDAELAALARLALGLHLGTARDHADGQTRDRVMLRILGTAHLQHRVDIPRIAAGVCAERIQRLVDQGPRTKD